MNNNENTLYSALGGEPGIRRLVELFYPKVQANPIIGPLFPADIIPVMEKQFMFLSQFFGGPSLYSDQYGHPMMRARHMPFPITPERANVWLSCMSKALEEMGLDEVVQAVVLERLKGTAHHFVNTDKE